MLELIGLLEVLVIFLIPLNQPVLGIVLRLPRVLGGRRLRVRREQVLHCKFAWVSTSMGVLNGIEPEFNGQFLDYAFLHENLSGGIVRCHPVNL